MGHSPDFLSSPPPSSSLDDGQTILRTLQQSAALDLATLMHLQRETIRLQPDSIEVYQKLAKALLRSGEPLIAYDVMSLGLKKWPQDLRLQQQMALALARSGATIAANTLLQQLVDQGQTDEKTLGLLARTHKDLWSQAVDLQRQQQHLALAAKRYGQAYHLSQSHWTGINAATMALLQGYREQAEVLAQRIQSQCLATLNANGDTDEPYWILATLGEAALILGAYEEAEAFYGQAIEIGQGRFGDLSSSCRNASLLIQHQGGDLGLLRRWFNIPRVAVFCGHVIDAPDRPVPRFPPALEGVVYKAIRDRLQQFDIRFGYASAACGADILFLEALLELKGEIHIVLPYEQQQFIRDAVDILPTGQWRQRFDRVMAQATEVVVASRHKAASAVEVAYEYSYRVLHGLGKIRATQLGTEFLPLSVWNGQPSDDIGGTSSAVQYWQQWSNSVEIIDLAALLKANTAVAVPPRAKAKTAPLNSFGKVNSPESLGDFNPEIRAMLFADVVHFTHLREEQFPAFVQHFLGTVAQFSEDSDHTPLFQNTWGDALYFVFATVQKAGLFALELCDLIQTSDWSTKGLPPNMTLRMALHAGPVTRHCDPITSHENYMGTHVNHTARIEPITPPGKVYSSQAFAALASSAGVTEFSCDYVGKTPYAKQYGTFPTYHVCRRRV